MVSFIQRQICLKIKISFASENIGKSRVCSCLVCVLLRWGRKSFCQTWRPRQPFPGRCSSLWQRLEPRDWKASVFEGPSWALEVRETKTDSPKTDSHKIFGGVSKYLGVQMVLGYFSNLWQRKYWVVHGCTNILLLLSTPLLKLIRLSLLNKMFTSNFLSLTYDVLIIRMITLLGTWSNLTIGKLFPYHGFYRLDGHDFSSRPLYSSPVHFHLSVSSWERPGLPACCSDLPCSIWQCHINFNGNINVIIFCT